MKVVKVKELFGTIPGWKWNGQEFAFEYKGELYLPLYVARDWYIVPDAWIEEIDYAII